MVLEQTIRILAEPAIIRTPRGLNVGDAPRPRTEHTEQRLRMRCAGTDLEVEWLLQETAVRRPVGRQLENEVLEGHAWRRSSRSTRSDFNVFSRCVVIILRCTVSSSL